MKMKRSFLEPARDRQKAAHVATQDRSEKTRQRLVEVAIEAFGLLGFEGASTRKIVEKAQANLVSISYYFGNKEGLYRAAAEHIGEGIAEKFIPLVLRVREELHRRDYTHEETRELFIGLLVEFAEMMLGSESPDSWGRFISREQFEPTAAFEIIHDKIKPLLDLCMEFVGRLTGQPTTSELVRLRALSTISMMKFCRMDRAFVMRAMGWTEIGIPQLPVIREMIRTNITAMFADSNSLPTRPTSLGGLG